MKRNRFVVLLCFFLTLGLVSCGCEHRLKKELVQEPTCLEDGVGILRCTRCGKRSERVTIPALGHNYVLSTKEPNCIEKGYTIRFCTRCGEESKIDEKEIVDSHKYAVTDVPATCLEDGYTFKKCVLCGKEETIITEPKKGHDLWECEGKAATCLEDGYQSYQKCSRCDYETEKIKIPALGHDYESRTIKATCVERGHLVMTCKRCGNEYVKGDIGEIDPTAHQFIVNEVPATCLEDGYRKSTCVLCGKTETVVTESKKGHDIQSFSGKSATCTEKGYFPYSECTRCDYSTKKYMLPLGHDYGELQTMASSTYKHGYKYRKCKRCSDIKIENELECIKPNQIVSAYDLDREAKMHSFGNDDVNYFVVYGGRVKDMVLHKYADFWWDEEVERMKAYPKNVVTMDNQTVKEDYTRLLTNATLNIKNDIVRKLGLDSKNVVNFSEDSIDDVCSGLVSKFNVSAMESDNGSGFDDLCKQINQKRQSFSIEKEKYEYGNQYAYCAIADVDFYVGMKYDFLNKKLYFKTYSALASSVSEKIYASHVQNEDIGSEIEKGTTLNPNASFAQVESYKTNHEKIQITEEEPLKKAYGDNNKVPVNIHGEFYFDLTLIDLNDYIAKGYDKMSFEMYFNFTRGGNTALHLAVLVLEADGTKDSGQFVGTNEKINDPGDYYRKYNIDLKLLEGRKGISIVFWNENWINKFDFSISSCTLTYYNSRARY